MKLYYLQHPPITRGSDSFYRDIHENNCYVYDKSGRIGDKAKGASSRLIKRIPGLSGGDDELHAQIYYLLVRTELYSGSGITKEELSRLTGKNRETIRKKRLVMKETELLKTARVGKEKLYGIH